MENIVPALRYAFTGVLVAVGVDIIADMAGSFVIHSINTASGEAPAPLSQLMRVVTSLVVSATAATIGVLAGENILNLFNAGVDDPLYRWFYYNAAFMASSSARTTVNNVAALYKILMSFLGDGRKDKNPIDPNKLPPKVHTGPVISNPPVSTGPYVPGQTGAPPSGVTEPVNFTPNGSLTGQSNRFGKQSCCNK